MEYKRVKLTKVGLTDRIEVGYIKEGYMVVREMFLLYPHNKVAPIFHTSLITEVEFRMLNSLYKIEVIWKD